MQVHRDSERRTFDSSDELPRELAAGVQSLSEHSVRATGLALARLTARQAGEEEVSTYIWLVLCGQRSEHSWLSDPC